MKFLNKAKGFLGVLVLLATVIYFFATMLCVSDGCSYIETDYLEPLFFGLLGLLPSALYLMFFTDQVFISWLKQIALWALPLILIVIFTHDPNRYLFSEPERSELAALLMSALFTITLIYAPLMNRRLKRGQTDTTSK